MKPLMIEKGIPVPEVKDGGRPKGEYGAVVEMMGAGESVMCDSPAECCALRSAAQHRGIRTRQRKVEGGWRVWVIERGIEYSRTPKQHLPEAQKVKAKPGAAAVVAAPVIPLVPPKRAEPGDMPAMDDARVTELHALCIAFGCRATILNARAWVSEGVSAEQLRSALNRIPRPASVTALDSILHESEAA